MEDLKIIALFYQRSEQAIIELSNKYGAICRKVANNILNNRQDTEECLNDAYLGAWNTIPPQNPNPLLTYICRIVRNLAIKRYHANTAAKTEIVPMTLRWMNWKTVFRRGYSGNGMESQGNHRKY